MYARFQKLPLSTEETCFLWGPRQTGKSTLLKRLFPESTRYDLLLSDTYQRLLRRPDLLRQECKAAGLDRGSQKNPVIIDEIQKLPMLLDEVHWLIENRGIREIAALTNGEIVNYTNIAGECGVSSPTVKEYFQILEDTLVARHLPAFQKRRKRRLITSPKFYFFDLSPVIHLTRRQADIAGPRAKTDRRQHRNPSLAVFPRTPLGRRDHLIADVRTTISKLKTAYFIGNNAGDSPSNPFRTFGPPRPGRPSSSLCGSAIGRSRA